MDGERDKVIGILLAKDLLRYYAEGIVRRARHAAPGHLHPESKRLNVLLRDFRANHNHMAIVVDEYGGVAGLITIEDVLEQIVGDIEDEYDFDEAEDNILSLKEGRTAALAHQGADRDRAVQRRVDSRFSDDDVDTIGGLVAKHLGRVPRKGDEFDIDGLHSKCCAPMRARCMCCWCPSCRRHRWTTSDRLTCLRCNRDFPLPPRLAAAARRPLRAVASAALACCCRWPQVRQRLRLRPVQAGGRLQILALAWLFHGVLAQPQASTAATSCAAGCTVSAGRRRACTGSTSACTTTVACRAGWPHWRWAAGALPGSVCRGCHGVRRLAAPSLVVLAAGAGAVHAAGAVGAVGMGARLGLHGFPG
jgi:CBS domain-containing protein